MSGFNIDMNPSVLGGGAPGSALRLLGGGGGSSGGSGMVGGSARGRNRFALRNAFKTNRIGPYYKFSHYQFTRQNFPNGSIAGFITDGITITPTNPDLPITLSAPFYDANGNVHLTYPGQLINTTTPAVIDLTQDLIIYANTPVPPALPNTLFVKGKTSSGQDVVFLNGASVELFNDRQVVGLRALCGPFRAAMSAGDVLGRKDQSAGGANMVTAVNGARNHGSARLGGAVSTTNVGDSIVIGGETFITGTGAGQTPLQSGNPRHVYDGSDFIRYKKLAAINKNYNDKSFGGPSKAGAGGSGVFTALGRVRR
jgi:hypothetical protein